MCLIFFIFSLLTMGKYFKEMGEKGGKESLQTQLTLKWKRKKQKKHYIFSLFWKAYERKEFVLVYCKV